MATSSWYPDCIDNAGLALSYGFVIDTLIDVASKVLYATVIIGALSNTLVVFIKEQQKKEELQDIANCMWGMSRDILCFSVKSDMTQMTVPLTCFSISPSVERLLGWQSSINMTVGSMDGVTCTDSISSPQQLCNALWSLATTQFSTSYHKLTSKDGNRIVDVEIGTILRNTEDMNERILMAVVRDISYRRKIFSLEKEMDVSAAMRQKVCNLQ